MNPLRLTVLTGMVVVGFWLVEAPAEPAANGAAPETNPPSTNPAAMTSEPAATVTGPAPAEGLPAIDCQVPTHDFGEIKADEPQHHTFVLKNAGTAPLEIRGIRASCNCTTSTLATNLLEPGQTVELPVTISFKGSRGRQRRTLYVESNDPETPRFRLELLATVVRDVDMQPEGVFFGNVTREQVVTNTVTITGRSNVVFHVTAVHSDSPLFAARVITNEPGRAYLVEIVAQAPRPSGSSRAMVRVATDWPAARDLVIPVTAFVPGELMFIPTAVMLAAQTTNACWVNLYSPVGRDFKVLKITPPDAAMEVKAVPMAPGRYRLEVRYSGPVEHLRRASVRVETDLPEAREVEIPIRIMPFARPVRPSPQP